MTSNPPPTKMLRNLPTSFQPQRYSILIIYTFSCLAGLFFFRFSSLNQLMVPEKMPTLIWEHLRRHRTAESPKVPESMIVKGVSSTPFTWEECSNAMGAVCTRLNELNEADNGKASTDTPKADTPASTPKASAAAAPTPSQPVDQPPKEAPAKGEVASAPEPAKSDKPADGATSNTRMRLKCSRPSCTEMSTKEKPLLACARCHNAH